MTNEFDNFLNRMKVILGEEYEDFEKSLSFPIQKSIYVNENKIDIEYFKDIVDFSIEQIPYEKAGFYVSGEKFGKHPLHQAGAFYCQEPSAMFTVNSIKFVGNEKVLDMCAAPGGKSIQIANRIPNGILLSNEFNRARSEILFSNIERMGLKNVIITNDSSENIAKAYTNTFDVCLVDAPCSGEGMFRRGEDVVKEWNENLPKMCAKRQIEILENANKCLKKDGLLIYSTCTYSLEENEHVVQEFLSKHEYEIVNIEVDLPRGIGVKEAVRLYPHKVRGEGQFVAVMKKLEVSEESYYSNVKLEKDRLSREFLKKYTSLTDEEIDKVYSYSNKVFYIKDKNMIRRGVYYVSSGVKVGEVKNFRFEPHHNLFSAFGDKFNLKLELNYQDKDLASYLKGEVLGVDLKDGYGAMIVSGCPLGGFKISQGKFKNHYPKGLRN